MTPHEVAIDFSGSWMVWEGSKGGSRIWVVWSLASTGQLGSNHSPWTIISEDKN